MQNTVLLTDDELIAIQVSLEMNIKMYEKVASRIDVNSLDRDTLEAIETMKALHNRLSKECF